jgi:LPPG:FO 2-phospho-L-lactate transferase
MLVVLGGGTGGAKLIEGLSHEIDAAQLTVVCNTADDFVLHGLNISPDLDTIMYTLAGMTDGAKGWESRRHVRGFNSSWKNSAARRGSNSATEISHTHYPNTPPARGSQLVRCHGQAERLASKPGFFPCRTTLRRELETSKVKFLSRIFRQRHAGTGVKGFCYAGVAKSCPAPVC